MRLLYVDLRALITHIRNFATKKIAMEELFSGCQAVTPQFKVVQTDRRGRPHTEKAEERLERDEADKITPSTRRTRKGEADPRENRTVFVGNLPATVTRRKLKQLFSQHGKVASVRLRSMVVEKGKLPVRVAKRKQQQVTSSTINAYVVFEEEEQAEKALVLNGALVGDRHIRVDLAGRAKDHTHERSVFVGGLPYSADDEEVREVFMKYGDVESVRVVREPKTGVGKGFGFVTFVDRSGIMFTLQHRRQLELSGQRLRVMKSKDMTQVRGHQSVARFAGRRAKTSDGGGGKRQQEAVSTSQKKQSVRHRSGTGHRIKFSRQKDKKVASTEKRDKVRVPATGLENRVRPSRTFHKKKEARQREREKSQLGSRSKRRGATKKGGTAASRISRSE